MPRRLDNADLANEVACLRDQISQLERLFESSSQASLDHILTPQQLSSRLGVTERTLAEWRVSPPGVGPAFLRIGRGVRYRLDSVDAWLLSQERTSTREEARR